MRYPPFRERVLSRYVVDPETGCWEWTGSRNKSGYGQLFGQNKATVVAHRATYELLVASIPAGMQLDHLCRNRGCVNPAHLEVVTPAENAKRGMGVSGINGRKLACGQGHPLEGANLYRRPNGWRECRTCIAAYRNLYRCRREEKRLLAMVDA